MQSYDILLVETRPPIPHTPGSISTADDNWQTLISCVQKGRHTFPSATSAFRIGRVGAIFAERYAVAISGDASSRCDASAESSASRSSIPATRRPFFVQQQ